MKFLNLVIITILMAGCSQTRPQTEATKIDSTTVLVKTTTVNQVDDKTQIQNLIRKMLVWSQNHGVDLLPAIQKDTLYIGFNLVKLEKTIAELKATNLFSATFTENYKQIILALDKKIRNKETYDWDVRDMPPFAFASGIDPWCYCQDVPYDEPNAYELVEVYPVNVTATKGSWIWKWGSLKPNTDKSWGEISYKFDVEKESGVWKIAYMQGFDFKQSTR